MCRTNRRVLVIVSRNNAERENDRHAEMKEQGCDPIGHAVDFRNN